MKEKKIKKKRVIKENSNKEPTCRKWELQINTSFSKIEDFDKESIVQWGNLTKNNKINFVLYRFIKYKPDEENSDIEHLRLEAYIELSNTFPASIFNKMLSFPYSELIAKKITGTSNNAIITFIEKCSNPIEELFWFGTPRFEKKTLLRSDFKFIREYNLVSKIKSSYSVPDYFQKILIEKQLLTSTKFFGSSLDDLRNNILSLMATASPTAASALIDNHHHKELVANIF